MHPRNVRHLHPRNLGQPHPRNVWQAMSRTGFVLSPWPWRSAAYLLSGAVCGAVTLVGIVTTGSRSCRTAPGRLRAISWWGRAPKGPDTERARHRKNRTP